MLRFGILGCGYVSDSYLATRDNHTGFSIVGCCDQDAIRTRKLSEFGKIRPFGSLEEMLEAPNVDAVINLTNPRSHFETTKACLQAGKHVYSEKPIGLTVHEAQELLDFSKRQGLQLATAPCSVLSPAAQTLGMAIESGLIGNVRLVYANFDDGMIAPFMTPWEWTNSIGVPWPAKDEFEVGCTMEHAGYFLSWLCTFFGSARKVTSFAGCLIPDKGIRVEGMAPDFTTGTLEFQNGVVARVTCGLVAPLDKTLTVIGDDGVLLINNLRDDMGDVWHKPRELSRWNARSRNSLDKARHALGAFLPQDWIRWIKYSGQHKIPLVGDLKPIPGDPEHKRADFLRGPAELAASVAEMRPCRLPGELGVHMVEIIEALQYPGEGPVVLKTKL